MERLLIEVGDDRLEKDLWKKTRVWDTWDTQQRWMGDIWDIQQRYPIGHWLQRDQGGSTNLESSWKSWAMIRYASEIIEWERNIWKKKEQQRKKWGNNENKKKWYRKNSRSYKKKVGLRLKSANDEMLIRDRYWKVASWKVVNDFSEAENWINGNKRKQLVRSCYVWFWGHL